MLKEIEIKLEENDRLDLNLAITTRNTALSVLQSVTNANEIMNFKELTEVQIRDYFAGICDAFIEAELTLHSLRKIFSEKYHLPYDFASKDGDIFLTEANYGN